MTEQEWLDWFYKMWKEYKEHPPQASPDLWALNQVSVMGENVGNLLRILDDREKRIAELREMLAARGEALGLGQ